MTAAQRRDVESVIPMVHAMVTRRYQGLPGWVERADLVQAAMESVCRARSRFDPDAGASWSTYAMTRAQGAVIDHLRSQRPGTRHDPRPHPISLDLEVELDDGTVVLLGDQVAVEDPALRAAEIEHDLSRALGRLSAEQGSTVRRWLDGALLREIAASDGVTEAAVNQRMHRARLNLTGLRGALA